MVEFILGVLLTGSFSFFLYYRSSQQLKKEAKLLREETGRLKDLNLTMLEGMEDNDWIDLSRNQDGEIVGFKRKTVRQAGGISSKENVPAPNVAEKKTK